MDVVGEMNSMVLD